MFDLLDTQWHIGHQYELLKFPFARWSWLLQYKRRYLDLRIRGDLSTRFASVTHYEAGVYDAVVLHLDQESLYPHAWNYGKGVICRDLRSLVRDTPTIVMMHGSPYHPEAKPPFNSPDWLIERFHEITNGCHVIVNSHQAAREWRTGTAIIHGMDPDEWYDLPKRPRVITSLSSGGMHAYYDRPFLRAVKEELLRCGIEHCQIGLDYTPTDWYDYRRLLGSSLIYFNPTRAAPMPRARTEAMLSGCCIFTTPYHDADSFIVNGYNGFLVQRDAAGLVRQIQALLSNPEEAKMIGQRGKQTALKLFHWNRFANNWLAFLTEVTGGPRRQ